MKTLKIIPLLLMMMVGVCQSAVAQSDAEKKATAIDIQSSNDFYSYQISTEWENKTVDYDKLVKKAKQNLLKKHINPERSKKGLRTSFKLERWDPLIKTIIYRDRYFDYIVAYIPAREMFAFGVDSDMPTPGPAPENANRQFGLPEGVNLQIPKGVMEALTELYDNPEMSLSDVESMLYDLWCDRVISDAEPVTDILAIPTSSVLYEIGDNDRVGRLIGYGANGNFYDIRSGDVVSLSEFANSKWMVITYDHTNLAPRD